MEYDTRPIKARPGRELILLWLCVVAGPLAWSVQLAVSYPLVGPTCDGAASFWLHGVSLVTFLVCLVSAMASWRRIRRGDPIAVKTVLTDRADVAERELPARDFLAISGLILSSFFLLVILTQWMPVLVLNPCL